MLPSQRSFHSRLTSEFDDRKTWLQSIIHCVLGRPAEEMNDDDEKIVYEKLRHALRELDNLREFEKKNIDISREEAIKIEITTLIDGMQKNTMGFPKKKIAAAQQVKQSLRRNLTTDTKINIFALIDLLKEEIQNG
jgi:hypothetical protein